MTDLDASGQEELSCEHKCTHVWICGTRNLKDIIADLLKPGRDLRDSFDAPVLRQDVLDIKDLHIGQKK